MDSRTYPVRYADLARTPLSRATTSEPLGPPPDVPWSAPTLRSAVHVGASLVEVPRRLLAAGLLGGDVVATGTCGLDSCRSGPADVFLLDPGHGRGRITAVDPARRPHDVLDLAISPDRRSMAWTSGRLGRGVLYVYRVGRRAAEETAAPAPSGPRRSRRVVGMMGAGDVLVAQRAPGGRTLAYARTSGAPARWNARFLAVAAPDLLLGQPGFTPLDQTCRAAFDPSRTAPRWTVCYRAGRRPAELYEFSASATGRWLVATGLDEVVLFSGADGMPTRRIRFDDRVQYARAEDDGHFLVVLTAPNPDDGPTVSWMVRCTLRLRCQEVTPHFTALYDTVRFVPD